VFLAAHMYVGGTQCAHKHKKHTAQRDYSRAQSTQQHTTQTSHIHTHIKQHHKHNARAKRYVFKNMLIQCESWRAAARCRHQLDSPTG
jgi:hypothetical protein